jgi:hypothetical protein
MPRPSPRSPRHARNPKAPLPTKPCTLCGRDIAWRKKWERDWETVKYCSDRCRKAGLAPIDQRLEHLILALLAQRPHAASICPSEAARLADPTNWQPLMEPARAAARRLASRGQIEVTQSGHPVPDLSRTKGPIRLRLPR